MGDILEGENNHEKITDRSRSGDYQYLHVDCGSIAC